MRAIFTNFGVMMKFWQLLIFILLTFILSACSTFGQKKDNTLFNLTPQAWFSQILKDLRELNYDAADEHYISFASEHINSDLLAQTTLILAMACADNEKYLMANFYLDEYIKRFATRKEIEYARFLKIKANFDSFSKPNRNQKLMIDNVAQIEKFLVEYPNTQFRPLLETMLAKLKLAQFYLDQEIAKLYERTGKDESAQVYKDRLESTNIDDKDMIKPNLPWYMLPFE